MAKKTRPSNGELFIEESGQLRMADKSAEQRTLEGRPVVCLGLTFESDDARRAYFLDKLREKLRDPELRKMAGFPTGSDEDILRLSDPPYYTACPNPFLPNIIAERAGRGDDEEYHRAPYASDLAESGMDDIYTAHTYHTKVPPRAIARLILHYTKPGDVVLDVFGGSGMTGVAAQMCGDSKIAGELGGEAGPRIPILCDLSPAATLIAANYLAPVSGSEFSRHATALLRSTEQHLGNLYSIAGDNRSVDFVVWVEAFTCPHCQKDILSEQVLSATENIGSANEFACPHCSGLVSKAPTTKSGASRLVRHLETFHDPHLRGPATRARRVPVAVQVRSSRGAERLELSAEARQAWVNGRPDVSEWFPTDKIIEGERFKLKDCLGAYGITHIHHFYLPKQLSTMAYMWRSAAGVTAYRAARALQFWISSNSLGLTLLNRFAPTHHSQVNRYFSGTLYVPSTVAETSPRYAFENKIKRLTRAFDLLRSWRGLHAITTQSAAGLSQIPDASVDYVFTDPPFGRNLQYSELNQIWEAWLRVHTNRSSEAVMDATRKVGVAEYTRIMREIFAEVARVLKPARWVTVEFHNSSNAVWMAIQEAMSSAGLVVADVRVLSKESETYKQSKQGLVKRDLMISAYRAPAASEQRLRMVAGQPAGAWEFARMHLAQLPLPSEHGGALEVMVERQDFMLFDRMVGFHVQRGIGVPLSSAGFIAGLRERFSERDGMFFLPEQVAEYDRARARAPEVKQQDLFVQDEASAIQWLRRELSRRPQSIQDLHPTFMKQLPAWSKHESTVELKKILDEQFLRYSGQGPVPTQIHAYLSTNFKELRNREKDDPVLVEKARDRWYVADPRKQEELDKLREKALLKEFAEYSQQRKLKQFRSEAIRAGFKAAYEAQDYKTIVTVAGKLPEAILQEDEKLLMYYDVASMRLGAE